MGKEYTVAYRLSDEQDRELRKVTGSHNRVTGRSFSAEEFFRGMMKIGAGEEISRKLGIFRGIYGVSEEKKPDGRKHKTSHNHGSHYNHRSP